MITTISNNDGYIYGYMQWHVIDSSTRALTDEGDLLFVEDAWVHKHYRHCGVMKELIARVFESSMKYNYLFVQYHRIRRNRDSKYYEAPKYLKHTRLRNLFEEAKHG